MHAAWTEIHGCRLIFEKQEKKHGMIAEALKNKRSLVRNLIFLRMMNHMVTSSKNKNPYQQQPSHIYGCVIVWVQIDSHQSHNWTFLLFWMNMINGFIIMWDLCCFSRFSFLIFSTMLTLMISKREAIQWKKHSLW